MLLCQRIIIPNRSQAIKRFIFINCDEFGGSIFSLTILMNCLRDVMFATISVNERNDRNKKLFYLNRDFEYTSIRFFLFFPFETGDARIAELYLFCKDMITSMHKFQRLMMTPSSVVNLITIKIYLQSKVLKIQRKLCELCTLVFFLHWYYFP